MTDYKCNQCGSDVHGMVKVIIFTEEMTSDALSEVVEQSEKEKDFDMGDYAPEVSREINLVVSCSNLVCNARNSLEDILSKEEEEKLADIFEEVVKD